MSICRKKRKKPSSGSPEHFISKLQGEYGDDLTDFHEASAHGKKVMKENKGWE